MNEVWDLSILYKDFDDPAFVGGHEGAGRSHRGGEHAGR